MPWDKPPPPPKKKKPHTVRIESPQEKADRLRREAAAVAAQARPAGYQRMPSSHGTNLGSTASVRSDPTLDLRQSSPGTLDLTRQPTSPSPGTLDLTGAQGTARSGSSGSARRALSHTPKRETSEEARSALGRKRRRSSQLSHPSHSRDRVKGESRSRSLGLLDPSTSRALSATTAATQDTISLERTLSREREDIPKREPKEPKREPKSDIEAINMLNGAKIIKWAASKGLSYNDFMHEQASKGIDPAGLGNSERAGNYPQFRKWLKVHIAGKHPRPASKPLPRIPKPSGNPATRPPDRDSRAPPVVDSSGALGGIMKRDLPPDYTNTSAAIPGRSNVMQSGRLASGRALPSKRLVLDRYIKMSPKDLMQYALKGEDTITWKHFATTVLKNPNLEPTRVTGKQYKQWFLARVVQPRPDRSRILSPGVRPAAPPLPGSPAQPAPPAPPGWKPKLTKTAMRRMNGQEFDKFAQREGVLGFLKWIKKFKKRGEPAQLTKSFRNWAVTQLSMPPDMRHGYSGPRQRPPRQIPLASRQNLPPNVPKTKWTKAGLEKLIRGESNTFADIADQYDFSYERYIEEFGSASSRGRTVQQKWLQWAMNGILQTVKDSDSSEGEEGELEEEGEIADSSEESAASTQAGGTTPVRGFQAPRPPLTPAGKKEMTAALKELMKPGRIDTSLTKKLGYSQWDKFAAFKSNEIGTDLSWATYNKNHSSASRPGWRASVVEAVSQYYKHPGSRTYQRVDQSDSGPHGRSGVRRALYPASARVLSLSTADEPPSFPQRGRQTATGQPLSPAGIQRTRPRTEESEPWEAANPFAPNAEWLNYPSDDSSYPSRASRSPSGAHFQGTYDMFSEAERSYVSGVDERSEAEGEYGYVPAELSDYPGDMPEMPDLQPAPSPGRGSTPSRTASPQMLSRSPDPYAPSPQWDPDPSDSGPVLRDSSHSPMSPAYSPMSPAYQPLGGGSPTAMASLHSRSRTPASPATPHASPSTSADSPRYSPTPSPPPRPPPPGSQMRAGRVHPHAYSAFHLYQWARRGTGGLAPYQRRPALGWVPRGGRGRGRGRSPGGRAIVFPPRRSPSPHVEDEKEPPPGGFAGPDPVAPAPAPVPVPPAAVPIPPVGYPARAAPRRNVHRRRIIPSYRSGTNRAMAGMAAWSKTPEFSFKNTAPGRYTLRAFRGVTNDIRTHLRALIRKAPHSLWVNGKKMNKKQAFSLIIDLLNKLEVVQVGLSN